ncbi:hypothetical protein Hdeb2414_s0008g00266221 [Helianthus debilis subsp. tardiflorus]
MSSDYCRQAKRAALMAHFIIHKPRERSHFTKAALKTVSVFVKACKEQIDVLKTSITDEQVNSKGWLGIRADNDNACTQTWSGMYSFFSTTILFGIVVILNNQNKIIGCNKMLRKNYNQFHNADLKTRSS